MRSDLPPPAPAAVTRPRDYCPVVARGSLTHGARAAIACPNTRRCKLFPLRAVRKHAKRRRRRQRRRVHFRMRLGASGRWRKRAPRRRCSTLWRRRRQRRITLAFSHIIRRRWTDGVIHTHAHTHTNARKITRSTGGQFWALIRVKHRTRKQIARFSNVRKY